MNKPQLLLILIIFIQCQSKKHENSMADEEIKLMQDSIINEFVDNCAKNYNYRFQMAEWQNCLDMGLERDSTIAYLWQQKAMPYFKARKYEVGMKYIDKAVKYAPEYYQPYRAFIKCIFAKTYNEAIIDFKDCIDKYGDWYEMDHSYSFYIGISYLQLNEFEKAEEILGKEIQKQVEKHGEAHYLDLFYFGISKYEQAKWEEAIIEFDKALEQYPRFSDVKYYKSICFVRLNKFNEAKKLLIEAEEDGIKYTINEDNAIYETYPYQVRW